LIDPKIFKLYTPIVTCLSAHFICLPSCVSYSGSVLASIISFSSDLMSIFVSLFAVLSYRQCLFSIFILFFPPHLFIHLYFPVCFLYKCISFLASGLFLGNLY
ncbi:hypothetical protein L208DRAFT_1477607, partial [Tricholoma matsutake]